LLEIWETANVIKDSVDAFLKNDLFPRLEMLLDELNIGNDVVRFDELTVTLSIEKWNDYNNLQNEIYRQMKEKITLQIPAIKEINIDQAEEFDTREQSRSRISATRNSEDVFLFFLENGYLPWYGRKDQILGLSKLQNWKKSLDNQPFFRDLDQILTTGEIAADRFIIQFPDEMIIAYLHKKDLRITAKTSAVLKISQNLDRDARRILLKLLIRIANDYFPGVSHTIDRLIDETIKADSKATEKMGLEQLKVYLHRILPEISLDDSVLNKIDSMINGDSKIFDPKQNFEKEKSEMFLEKEVDEMLVQNAGLILLHPFLKQFFLTTGIVGPWGNLFANNADLAVQSLHFLATGNEDAFEGNLVMEKFLCGVPLKMPVQKQSLLTEPIRNEANELLREVVRNWPALKNTSPDGLRQMFIQRDGKLFQEDSKYRLIVERKAQDVLLERLNWNISVIKLPWIAKLLFTEW
jgi:hypothetical protein